VIVYLARNARNGKCYVGKTKRSLVQRMAEHRHASLIGSPQPLHRAIRKHGMETFTWSELVNTECTEEELNLLEVRFIAECGTYGSAGYNATRGGDGVVGLVHTEDAKRRMSENRRGEKNHNYGKSWGRTGPMSEESKQKMREAALGREHSEETKKKIGAATSLLKRKPVSQCSKDGTVLSVYPSLNEAAAAVGGQANKISEVLCGHRRTHKGYVWQYALEGGQTADRVEV